ncbi:Uncharacterized membrane protein [Chitinophaga sp. YR573]|uniref:DUF1345 domain-containing protein n=1 Tax=Chitinophaga sp. YR573 TaxID=1881040 RepID=UPI0008CB284A|nr:DUF1345 domain-containing protein [Chitinophaga sp. YR573]SEW04286.1 Uncharacterized membrane protein [Chitinophaga sp. YR573]
MFGNKLMLLRPINRSLISLGLTALVFVLIRNLPITPLIRIMLLWDVFALTFITTCWIVFVTRSVTDIRQYARQDDGSRLFVFIFILLACFFSMLLVLLLMLSEESSKASMFLYIPVAVAGILFSWGMVHTMYTMHYAHMYYDDDENDGNKHAGGLEFPKENCPDYIDFAYFAFVIGMTFQVSDVEISSRKIRRAVLFHGLLAFGLNTFVVALAINLIAGLRH